MERIISNRNNRNDVTFHLLVDLIWTFHIVSHFTKACVDKMIIVKSIRVSLANALFDDEIRRNHVLSRQTFTNLLPNANIVTDRFRFQAGRSQQVDEFEFDFCLNENEKKKTLCNNAFVDKLSVGRTFESHSFKCKQNFFAFWQDVPITFWV